VFNKYSVSNGLHAAPTAPPARAEDIDFPAKLKYLNVEGTQMLYVDWRLPQENTRVGGRLMDVFFLSLSVRLMERRPWHHFSNYIHQTNKAVVMLVGFIQL